MNVHKPTRDLQICFDSKSFQNISTKIDKISHYLINVTSTAFTLQNTSCIANEVITFFNDIRVSYAYYTTDKTNFIS